MYMMNSIWAETAVLPKFPHLDKDLKTDVLIIGGGLAGILCAWAMGEAGIDYVLIEADELCGGVTRNTTAKITSQHGLIYDKLIREFDVDTARLYYEANEAALANYRRLCQGIDCDFQEQDAYVYTVNSPQKLEQELAALEKIHAKADFAETPSLPLPTAGAIRFRHQAQFHPLKFAAELAKGLRIYEHTRAWAFEGNVVRTNQGTIEAKHMVMATHFPMRRWRGSYFLKMYQHRSYVLALEGAGQMDGMYIDGEEGGLSFRNYGSCLLLGGGAHRTGKPGGCWDVLEEAAQAFYPGAKAVCRWATQDCMTLDGVPYIGQYSRGLVDHYVATGFGKWGMTGAMTAAMLLPDLIQGKENPYAAVFDPSRTMLRSQLLTNIWGAVTNLLTPTRPRCPHMGCALKWNPQERTWDCPCHGSRFSEDGTLRDNPAVKDLKRP